jgi:hypothetical protein
MFIAIAPELFERMATGKVHLPEARFRLRTGRLSDESDGR